MQEHPFTTYVRTKHVFKYRLKDLNDYDTVRIYMYELKKLGVRGPLLWKLREMGEIWYDKKGNFKALKEGPLNPSLLEKTKKNIRIQMPLNKLHLYMRDQLRYVEIDAPEKELSVYFKAFLKYRHKHIEDFFTVDSFSGRIHTPIVNLKHDLRMHIKFHGKAVVSLDVKQMQPQCLAKVLHSAIGENVFSNTIENGGDIYDMLQDLTGLKSRAEAKTMLFKLIFGKPMDDLAKLMQGNTEWLQWINNYKSTTENNNPHRQHTHTNLAWLLQYSEVQVMTGVWEGLKAKGIPFLTIHDDVIVPEGMEGTTERVMQSVLKQHFKTYDIVVTKH